MNNDRSCFTKKYASLHSIILVCVIAISLGLILEIASNVILNQILPRQMTRHHFEKCKKKPNYWVHPIHVDKNVNTLQHLHSVLKTIGYEKSTNQTPWKLLWVYGPIRNLKETLSRLKPNQRVNQIPNSHYITRKVSLATSNSKYIPKAFELPKSKALFLKYAKMNKKSLFLEKNVSHRGIRLKNVSSIDVTSGEKFVQKYIENPFLVDGHKFDIGVYAVIMSVNPLRVYWYKGDVGFRYCPLKYHPFDPKVVEKYVVGQHYLPTWELPTLSQLFSSMGHGTKDSFDIYLKSKGKDPSHMWEDIQRAIVHVLLIKQHYLVEASRHYRSQYNFFELTRFDLIIDENLTVYLLEANMSPNLNSIHYNINGVLFEQILYSLFSITGISRQTEASYSSLKHIAVFGEQCLTICKDNCTALELCGLCKMCRAKELEDSLLKAHSEYLHRADFRRLFPPAMMPNENINMLPFLIPDNLSPMDRLHFMWYQGKCNQDVTWCT